MELDKYARKYKTDKSSKYHGYVKIYNKVLDKFKDSPINFLEIGVERGASIKMWKSFLPMATVIGIDIKKNTKDLENIFIGDQKDPKLRDKIIKQFGNMDVIIDDGSHTHADQITSFVNFFPHLNSGGLYIIEDLGSSYWEDKKWSGGSRITTITYLKNLIDHVNTFGRARFAFLMKQDDGFSGYEKDIQSMTFSRYLCIIEKT